MPLPTASDVHVNRPLTNISVATIQEATNFVALQAFPIVPVSKRSDVYYSYDSAYWNSDEMQVRAPGTEAAGNGYAVDGTPNYFCQEYAFKKLIADSIRANADAPLNLDMEATKYVTLKALIKLERLFAANYMAGGVWTRDYDGNASSPGSNEVLQWNDASSTPIEDVWDAKAEVLECTGFEPNRLVLGYPVFKTLINHPDIVDRVKYGGVPGNPATIDAPELAQVFKVEKVLVSRGIYNSAKEGASSASHSFINGKNALLCYVPPAPGLMTPSAGYIFAWTGNTGAGSNGQRIKRYRDEPKASDVVEIEMYVDPKKVAADMGAFWDGVVA